MISAVNILLGVFWFLSAVVDYSEFCYIWQLKEYRIDRLKDFLSTEQGKNYWLKYPLLWRSSFAFLIFFWPFNEVVIVKYLLFILFILDFVYNLVKLYYGRIRFPSRTAKSLLIIFLSLLVEVTVYLFSRDWSLIVLLLIVRFFLITIIVQIINVLSKIVKKYLIKKATLKLLQYQKLIVIGITGSYGKTTTKNFLCQILFTKFKVFKTPKNINTEIGIAKLILTTDFSKFDIFIVEMGAYKIGEIKQICEMVKPRIGIFTAINEQHLSLFGDINKTQKAKYELLRSLPINGLAVVNSDNKYCREYLSELTCQVNTFGFSEEFSPTFLIKDVQKINEGLRFQGYMDSAVGEVILPIWGEHNVMNVAPAYLIGKYLGMKREEVREACRKLQMPENSMKIFNYGKSIIIDDSYNSNPQGFKAALQILNSYPSTRKRIVITRGMLELGEKSYALHQEIGEEISFVADELVVISPDYLKPLKFGVGDKYQTTVTLKYQPEELLSYVKQLFEEETVILLENRVPSIIHEEFSAKK